MSQRGIQLYMVQHKNGSSLTFVSDLDYSEAIKKVKQKVADSDDILYKKFITECPDSLGQHGAYHVSDGWVAIIE